MDFAKRLLDLIAQRAVPRPAKHLRVLEESPLIDPALKRGLIDEVIVDAITFAVCARARRRTDTEFTTEAAYHFMHDGCLSDARWAGNHEQKALRRRARRRVGRSVGSSFGHRAFCQSLGKRNHVVGVDREHDSIADRGRILRVEFRNAHRRVGVGKTHFVLRVPAEIHT